DKAEPVETGELAILEPELGDPNVRTLRIHSVAHRVPDGLGLLEDLLEHEVGIAGLFSRFAIPWNGARLSPNGHTIQGPEGDPVGGQHRQLAIVEDESLSRVLEQGRDV